MPESQCAESFTRYEHGRFNGPADHSLPPIPCPLRSRRRASSSVLGAIGLQRKSVRVPRRTGVPVSSLPTLYSIASALECILQRLCQDQHAQTSTDKRMYLHAYERTNVCTYTHTSTRDISGISTPESIATTWSAQASPLVNPVLIVACFRAVQARLANMNSQRKFRQQITEGKEGEWGRGREGKRERDTSIHTAARTDTDTDTNTDIEMSDADRNAGQEARKQRHGDRGDDKPTGTQPQVFRLQICDFWSGCFRSLVSRL